MLEVREIKNNIEEIKVFYKAVFTIEPWNDDWSDDNQLHQYITDLTGNANSLTFGLFRGEEMIGLSMGKIMHWYTGTQYYIDEFCIKTSEQGSGLGTQECPVCGNIYFVTTKKDKEEESCPYCV